MKTRKYRIVAWSLCAVAIAGAVVQLVLWATRLTKPPTLFDASEHLGWGLALPIVFSVLAAMIIARLPGNRVGWLMVIVALALSSPVGLILDRLSGPPAELTPGLWLLLWLGGWAWVPVMFPIILSRVAEQQILRWRTSR